MWLLNTKKYIIGQNMFGEGIFKYFKVTSFQIYVYLKLKDKFLILKCLYTFFSCRYLPCIIPNVFKIFYWRRMIGKAGAA